MGSVKKTPASSKKVTKTAAQRHAKEKREAATPTPKKKKGAAAAKVWDHTHHLPSAAKKAKNGRVEGRNLIPWNRESRCPSPLQDQNGLMHPDADSGIGPRMADKLLLNIVYECSRFKIELPWDNIAHRFHPGSSGSAIQQHLNRLRNYCLVEGHLVPPVIQKASVRKPVAVDPAVRGYIRAHSSGPDVLSTRRVLYTEPTEDLKFMLAGAYDNPDTLEAINSKIPLDLDGPITPAAATPTSGKAQRGTKKTGKARTKKERSPSPDPAELDGDDDYNPGNRGTAFSSARRPHRAKMATAYAEVEEDMSSASEAGNVAEYTGNVEQEEDKDESDVDQEPNSEHGDGSGIHEQWGYDEYDSEAEEGPVNEESDTGNDSAVEHVSIEDDERSDDEEDERTAHGMSNRSKVLSHRHGPRFYSLDGAVEYIPADTQPSVYQTPVKKPKTNPGQAAQHNNLSSNDTAGQSVSSPVASDSIWTPMHGLSTPNASDTAWTPGSQHAPRPVSVVRSRLPPMERNDSNPVRAPVP